MYKSLFLLILMEGILWLWPSVGSEDKSSKVAFVDTVVNPIHAYNCLHQDTIVMRGRSIFEMENDTDFVEFFGDNSGVSLEVARLIRGFALHSLKTLKFFLPSTFLGQKYEGIFWTLSGEKIFLVKCPKIPVWAVSLGTCHEDKAVRDGLGHLCFLDQRTLYLTEESTKQKCSAEAKSDLLLMAKVFDEFKLVKGLSKTLTMVILKGEEPDFDGSTLFNKESLDHLIAKEETVESS